MSLTKKISTFLLCFLLSFVSYSQADELTNINQFKGEEQLAQFIERIDFNKTRNPQLAIKLAEEAFERFDKEKLPVLLGKLHYQLGDTYYLTGEYPKALTHLQKAADLLSSQNDKVSLPLVYISMGRVIRKTQENCTKAKEYYQKAESIYQKTNNLQELATVQNYLGNLASQCENNFDKALFYHEQTASYYRKVNDKIGLSYSLDFISQIKAQEGLFDVAIQQQLEALELRKEQKDTFAIAISYTNLGEIAAMQNKSLDASNYFEQALKLGEKHQFNDLSKYLLGQLAELANKKGDFKLAYSLLQRQKDLGDQLLNESTQKQLTEMQTKYETEKKELELQEEQLKNKNKTLFLISLIIAILGLVILVAIILQKRKIDRQKQAILNLENLEKERSRIARDLHDNLGAELTLISSKIDMRLYKTINKDEKEELATIRNLSSNANTVLRETIWSINKTEITIDELVSKAEEYINRLVEDTPIRYSIYSENKNHPLSPATALHLFRIIQEAINNSCKYAQCTELKVAINKDSLKIEDNGKGFDLAAVKRGYGLQNLEQRAEELNALFTIDSQPNKGTVIQLTMPFSNSTL